MSKRMFPIGRAPKHLAFALLCAIFLLCLVSLDIRPLAALRGLSNLWMLMNDALPPDTAVWRVGLQGMIETLQIAYAGTFLGTLLCFPLGLLAARSLFPPFIVMPVRTLLSALRTVPSLLWAVIFVIVTGIGPLAGVLAIAISTVGYLGKLQSEAIEGINPEPLEALRAIGVRTPHLIWFVVLPETANHLIGHIFFMLEYNVRHSTVLGFVGAGGIGTAIAMYLRLLRYDGVLALLLIVLVAVLLLEVLGARMRSAYLQKH